MGIQKDGLARFLITRVLDLFLSELGSTNGFDLIDDAIDFKGMTRRY